MALMYFQISITEDLELKIQLPDSFNGMAVISSLKKIDFSLLNGHIMRHVGNILLDIDT
jgi:hypothetical protein